MYQLMSASHVTNTTYIAASYMAANSYYCSFIGILLYSYVAKHVRICTYKINFTECDSLTLKWQMLTDRPSIFFNLSSIFQSSIILS